MLLLTPPITTSSSGPHSRSSGRSALHSNPSGRTGGGVSTLFSSSPGEGGALKKAAVVAKRTGSQFAIIRGLYVRLTSSPRRQVGCTATRRADGGAMRPSMEPENSCITATSSATSRRLVVRLPNTKFTRKFVRAVLVGLYVYSAAASAIAAALHRAERGHSRQPTWQAKMRRGIAFPAKS